MKKNLNRFIGIIITLLSIYLLYSFVVYDILWIIKLGVKDEFERFIIILICAFSTALNFMVEPLRFIR